MGRLDPLYTEELFAQNLNGGRELVLLLPVQPLDLADLSVWTWIIPPTRRKTKELDFACLSVGRAPYRVQVLYGLRIDCDAKFLR